MSTENQLLFRPAGKQLIRLLKKLSGDEREKWHHALEKMLEGKNPWESFQTSEVEKTGGSDKNSILILEKLIDLFWKLSGNQDHGCLQTLENLLNEEDPFKPPVILQLMTAGLSGKKSIDMMVKNGYRFCDHAQEILLSKEFVTTDEKLYHLIFVMGKEFSNGKRTTRKIRAEATKRGHLEPPIEMGPYVLDLVSIEDLKRFGLSSLVIMHKPILTSDFELSLLGLYDKEDGRCLHTFRDSPDNKWGRDSGFLFLLGPETIPDEHVINCDAPPPILYQNFTVEEHIKGGWFDWDPDDVVLYLSEDQEEALIHGTQLHRELKSKPVFNINVAIYLVQNQHLIPEHWKDKSIFFWGTTYRDEENDPFVFFINWNFEKWVLGALCYAHHCYFQSKHPAAVLAD